MREDADLGLLEQPVDVVDGGLPQVRHGGERELVRTLARVPLEVAIDGALGGGVGVSAQSRARQPDTHAR